MVIDAFTFFNEWAQLQLRCEELKGVVDKHYLIESPTTFQGQPKPLHFSEASKYWKQYPIEVIVINLPHKGNLSRDEAWENEYATRSLGFNQIDIKDEDYILLSDVDEIPRASVIMESPGSEAAVCMQKLYYYWLNFQSPQEWKGTIRLTGKAFNSMSGQSAFMHRNSRHCYRIDNGGWHFSYLGGIQRIQEKIKAFAHSELNTEYYLDPQRIARKLQTGDDLYNRPEGFHKVPIDETYPKYLVENLLMFHNLIG